MKKQLLSLGILSAMIGMSSNLFGQDYIQKSISNENGFPSLVIMKENVSFSRATIPNVLKEILKLPQNNEMRLTQSEISPVGKFTDEKYQQYYHGIPVEFSNYNVHYKAGKLQSMNGEVFDTDGSPITPIISANYALDIAISKVGAQKYMWDDIDYTANNEYKKPKGDLVLLPIQQEDGSYRLILAYKFDIYAMEPVSRAYIYIDAIEGRMLMSNAIMKHSEKENSYHNHSIAGKLNPITVSPKPETQNLLLVAGNAATRYSGTQSIETTKSGTNYILSDTSRGNGVRTYNLKKKTTLSSAVDFTDADNNWTAAQFNNTAFDNAALDAHWGVEKTYDYFKTKFNRNSYDNKGSLLKSYVHYSSNYENAYWSGSEMVYGDGASYFSPLTAMDVTAHELGHGVCASTANLVYQGESGAMNEGLSDIWGAAVENLYAPNKQTWLIGEDITKVSPGYLRSMSNPKSGLSAQPDTYKGTNWYPASAAEGCSSPNSNTNDNCGVHTNSGVLNHWFYILSSGKTGKNDLGNSYNVTGIGIEKAAQIVYRMETAYLTSTSNYNNAKNYGIQAANDLFGAGSAEAIATQNAFYAVGLGTQYSQSTDTTPPTAPKNLVASNTIATQTTLTWGASTDNVAVDSYLIYSNNNSIGSVAGDKTTINVTGLSANTTYSFFVKAKDTSNNISAASNTVSVTTPAATQSYCASQGNTTTYEKIKNVTFNTINNTSTSSAGYVNFTNISTNVTKGSSYTIKITPSWSSTADPEGYAVYIDYNNDGVFQTTEKVFSKAATTAKSVSGTIKIPTTAATGALRMRVSMKYNGIPTACETFSYGQVQDYTINVGVAPAKLAEISATDIVKVYPNPASDFISIQSKKIGEYEYQIFNMEGRIVSKGNSSEKKISLQNLNKGIYLLEISFIDGRKLSQKIIKN